MAEATKVEEQEQPQEWVPASADDVLALDDLTREVVVVPEWRNARFTVQVPTSEQVEALREQAWIYERRTNKRLSFDNKKFAKLLFCAVVVEPKFSLEQYEQLQKKNARAVGRLDTAVMRVCGLSQEAADEATKSPEADADD